MARSGIYKSEVLRARDSLLAQGKNPSIDAIRAELGNTGSKTTIHRYLKELEEEEGASKGKRLAVSDAIQELAARLAARLHEEADSRIATLEAEQAAAIARLRDDFAVLEQRYREEQERSVALQSALTEEQALRQESEQGRQQLAIRHGQLQQHVADLQVRLADNQAHSASLEEKHQHARDSLEHYRQSVKTQREQDARRQEQHVQQLNAEIRTLGQTLIVKQDELTRLYQEAARTGGELLAASRQLRQQEQAGEQLQQQIAGLQGRVRELEFMVATQGERLAQAAVARDEAWQLLRQLVPPSPPAAEPETETTPITGTPLAAEAELATALPDDKKGA